MTEQDQQLIIEQQVDQSQEYPLNPSQISRSIHDYYVYRSSDQQAEAPQERVEELISSNPATTPEPPVPPSPPDHPPIVPTKHWRVVLGDLCQLPNVRRPAEDSRKFAECTPLNHANNADSANTRSGNLASARVPCWYQFVSLAQLCMPQESVVLQQELCDDPELADQFDFCPPNNSTQTWLTLRKVEQPACICPKDDFTCACRSGPLEVLEPHVFSVLPKDSGVRRKHRYPQIPNLPDCPCPPQRTNCLCIDKQNHQPQVFMDCCCTSSQPPPCQCVPDPGGNSHANYPPQQPYFGDHQQPTVNQNPPRNNFNYQNQQPEYQQGNYAELGLTSTNQPQQIQDQQQPTLRQNYNTVSQGDHTVNQGGYTVNQSGPIAGQGDHAVSQPPPDQLYNPNPSGQAAGPQQYLSPDSAFGHGGSQPGDQQSFQNQQNNPPAGYAHNNAPGMVQLHGSQMGAGYQNSGYVPTNNKLDSTSYVGPIPERSMINSVVQPQPCPLVQSNENAKYQSICSWMLDPLVNDPDSRNHFLQCQPAPYNVLCGRWQRMPCAPYTMFDSREQMCIWGSDQGVGSIPAPGTQTTGSEPNNANLGQIPSSMTTSGSNPDNQRGGMPQNYGAQQGNVQIPSQNYGGQSPHYPPAGTGSSGYPPSGGYIQPQQPANHLSGGYTQPQPLTNQLSGGYIQPQGGYIHPQRPSYPPATQGGTSGGYTQTQVPSYPATSSWPAIPSQIRPMAQLQQFPIM
uniref:Chitin-binding type-2 domain-containing protein n=1 Tax=Ditylenchus dipsaci TaxID=166011 RepID=A0A915DHL4_9BILA